MAKNHKVSYRKIISESTINRMLHRVVEVALSHRVPLAKIKNVLTAVKHRNALVGLPGEADELEFKGHLKSRAKRYFIDDEFLFHDGGYTYALTTNWSVNEVERIVKLLSDSFPHLKLVWEDSS